MNIIKNEIKKLLHDVGVEGEIELSTPPQVDMGDLAFGCFGMAKKLGKNPVEVAKEIKQKFEIRNSKFEILDRVEVFGPYVNFYLNVQELAKIVLDSKKYKVESKNKRVIVEFAHPNTHKAFHIGHLRNITTGETLVRILEHVGYEVIRANYQGDVGMHIAKSLWGIEQLKDEYEQVKNKSLHERIAFLGKAYAHGGQAYENDKKVEEEVKDLNKKIYERDVSIQDVYKTTRAWSLEYFDHIYKRVGSRFDRFYFESEVYESGKKIVHEFLEKGVFEESQGAIIFPGSRYGLHDRVFITSQGFPGYEAKEMALGRLQFDEYHPDEILHVVGKEQTGYFQVVFKALEQTLPESKDKEQHVIYGWVRLKEGKMSARTGKVVLGEWLIDEVKKQILDMMSDRELSNKDEVAEKISIAAVKYSFLKTGVANDIAFDFEESVSTTGDSGPYLLYIVARIKSILRKQETRNNFQIISNFQFPISNIEKKLLLQVARFSEVALQAAENMDPSKIAQYLFSLAQDFNNFYHDCPVLQADGDVKSFRLSLIQTTEQVMTKGLYLLGIETVEEM